jgi:hypothetical protein
VRVHLPGADDRAALVERLVGLAELAGDEALVGMATSALLALGQGDAQLKLAGERRARAIAGTPLPPPRGSLPWPQLTPERVAGPMWALWDALADAVAALGAHEPAQLGFGRGDRLALKNLPRQYPVLDAWLRAAGLTDVDLYVSASRAGVAVAVPLEAPLVFLGEDVARGEGLAARARLGRVLAAAKLKAGPLVDRDVDALVLDAAAAVRLGGLDPGKLPALAAATASRHLDEHTRLLGKALTRRGKKALPGALARLADLDDVTPFWSGMRLCAARTALVVAGDVPAAIDAVGRDLADELAIDAVGEDLLALRRDLGLPGASP